MCNAWNHPPSCRCGWGGDGHLGGGGDGWHGTEGTSSWPSYRLPEHDYWRFVREAGPSKCPWCGDLVFFLRHNGGCVYVDELGFPWPVHPCWLDQSGSRGARASAFAERLGFRSPRTTNRGGSTDGWVFGVVLGFRKDGGSRLVELVLVSGHRTVFTSEGGPDAVSLGGVVVADPSAQSLHVGSFTYPGTFKEDTQQGAAGLLRRPAETDRFGSRSAPVRAVPRGWIRRCAVCGLDVAVEQLSGTCLTATAWAVRFGHALGATLM
jgi:hypothetical protein